jgi:hypothetical protein
MQAPSAPVDSIPKQKEIDVANKKLHVVPNGTKSSVVLEGFDNDSIVTAITGWDQIGSLSSEVSTSLLAKQASIICERFRAENSEPERPSKRRKTGTPSEGDSSKDEHSSPPPSSDDSSEKDEQRVVSSDEESSTSSESSLPGCVSQQVDRMARMSKLLLEMENHHRLFRMETIAMAKDSGVDIASAMAKESGIHFEIP